MCARLSRDTSHVIFTFLNQNSPQPSGVRVNWGGFSENSCHFVFHALELLYSRQFKQPDNTSNRNVTPGGKDKLFLILDNQTVCEDSKAKLANEVLNVSLAVHANLTA